MFEWRVGSGAALRADDVCALVTELAGVTGVPDDGERIDLLEGLERLKGAIAAVQVRVTVDLDDSLTTRHEAEALQRQAEAGSRPRAVTADASIGAQVGLARHESPHQGRRHLGLARALVHDLPLTLAALERGDINEHRAQIIATETRDLCADDRRAVDAQVAELLARRLTMGDRELQHATQRAVMRIDQAGHLARRDKARARRGVTCRRVADGMAIVSGTISDLHAAAIMSSLSTAATRAVHDPADERTRAQVTADLFVERLTGQVTATAVPVHLNLVVSAETLLGGGDEPGEIVGHGPIPAGVARGLAVASPEHATRIRRLFVLHDEMDPDWDGDGDGRGPDRLIAMDSTSRTFDGLLREFILIRDQLCRTPWCNAPIRHVDHVTPAAMGGATDVVNAQGLCETCNYVKETPGWAHTPTTDTVLDRHEVDITTPTGQHHRSRAPAPPIPQHRRVDYLWVLDLPRAPRTPAM